MKIIPGSSPKKWSNLIKISDSIISLAILLSTLILIFYIIYRVYLLFTYIFEFNLTHIVHDIVYIVVLVKAYRILIAYLQNHHISIKYIVEISIISSSIEIIFASETHEMWKVIIMMIYGLVSLFLYLFFYKKLMEIDSD